MTQPLIRCDRCNKLVEPDEISCWENQHCRECHEEWIDREIAYWRPLYDGEVAGGFHTPKGRDE